MQEILTDTVTQDQAAAEICATPCMAIMFRKMHCLLLSPDSLNDVSTCLPFTVLSVSHLHYLNAAGLGQQFCLSPFWMLGIRPA